MRFGGRSVSQPQYPPITEVKFREEEVARRGSEEQNIISSEEEDMSELFAPFDQGSVAKQPQPPVIEQPEPEHVEIPIEYWKIFMAPATSSIEFPIGDIRGDAPMKPITLKTLPNFHGLSSEDPDTFLF